MDGLTNGTLSVIAQPTPPPVFTAVSHGGAGLVFAGTNGVRGWKYYVLSSTNLAMPLAGWKFTATNMFAPDGSFSITNPVSPGWVDCFYTLLLAP
jgi:hypothetical protein